MRIRISETKNLDLDTVANMLLLADSQTNFHPEARWIYSSSEGEVEDFGLYEARLSKRYKEFLIRWIGREAIVNWLTSNQILFEIISFDLLPDENAAISESNHIEEFNSESKNLN